MKILAIDDQQLVLLPLKRRLNELGYDVHTETDALKAKAVFDNFQPDLVIVDINMPVISGIEIIRYIRGTKKSLTPIMVLSGNTDDNLIVESFDLGVEDYMKKPLSLDEVSARVKRLIGATSNQQETSQNTIIQKRCVGVVIPCYDEEDRLSSKEFTDFVEKHSGYHLCFVNDGSKDNTLHILKRPDPLLFLAFRFSVEALLLFQNLHIEEKFE